MAMTQELYSVEEVAERLGLHVKTVRAYVRDGRLKAVRIGKQYRIARADLEALTGRPAAALDTQVRRHRHVEASSIVEIDAISAADANRLTTMLIAAAKAPRDEGERLRVETIYDEARAHLKVIVVGSLKSSGAILKIIDALSEDET
jgi:excisionase family DNA binding protein